MGNRRIVIRLVVAGAAVSLALAASGCVGRPGEDTDRLHAQASAALARWDAVAKSAGGGVAFAPTSDTTLFVGDDWGPNIDGGAAKVALMGGYFKATIELPGDTPSDGQIRWNDGTTLATGVLSAQAAFQAMTANGSSCTDCTAPLLVTSATLTTATFQTSRGPATAPAWEFSLKDTPVKIDQVAVAAQTITVAQPSWDPYNSPVGLRVDSATIDSSGLVLTANFVGAGGNADQPCGADYTAEAVESDTAVVVIIHEKSNQMAVACTAEGHFRTARVTLAKALGNRAVLEVQTGMPVPVTH